MIPVKPGWMAACVLAAAAIGPSVSLAAPSEVEGVVVKGAAAPPSGPVCTMTQTAEVKVEMFDGLPTVVGSVVGQPVRLVIATDGARSALTTAAVARLGLEGVPDRKGTRALAGRSKVPAKGLWLSDFELGGVAGGTSRFGVVPGDTGAIDGAIGNDFFHDLEVEFDFPGGAMRFFKVDGCAGAWLAYWSDAAVRAALRPTDVGLAVEVRVNGRPLLAEFATSKALSVLSIESARMVGIGPNSPGAEPANTLANGRPSWFVPLDSFQIGAETVHRTRIRVGDLNGGAAYEKKTGTNIPVRLTKRKQMALGADFFAAHRVLISQSQRQIYVHYVGEGPLTPAGLPAAAESDATILRVWLPTEGDMVLVRGGASD